MSLSPYFMNVALHAVLLSAAASLALVFVRKPARRGALALAAVISVGVLPWVSPLLSVREAEAFAEVSPRATADLAAWKVFTIPVDDLAVYEGPAESTAPVVALPSARTLAAWAWLGGTCLGLLAIAGSLARLGRWRASLERPHSSQAEVLGDALPPGLAVEDILLSKEAGSPCVTGFRRPLMVLPEHLLETCSTRELGWVLRHEQGHLDGKDSRWTLLMALVRAGFWWNPLVHRLGKEWAAAREEVCDLRAEGAERAEYGDFLVRIAAACPAGRSLVAAMACGAKRRLRKRIVALLNAPERADSGAGRFFVPGSVVVLLVFGLCASCVRIGGMKEEGGASLEAAAEQAPAQVSVKAGGGLKMDPRWQVKYQNTVFFSSAPLAKNGAVLSPDEYKKLMAGAATTRGNRLFHFPAITARASEKGLIEVIREKPASPGLKRVTAGWELSQTSRYDGKFLRLGSQVRYAFVSGGPFSPSSVAGLFNEAALREGDWDKLVVKKGDAEAKLPAGHVLVTTLGEVSPGVYSTLFTKVEPIDAGGMPFALADAAGLPEPEPVKEVLPVNVRVRGILLEDLSGFAPPEGVPSLGGMFTPEQWKLVQGGMDCKPLGEFTLKSGREAEPWKALPGVKLVVKRYKGDPHIDVGFSLPPPAPRNPRYPTRYGIVCDPQLVLVAELAPAKGGGRRCRADIFEEVK